MDLFDSDLSEICRTIEWIATIVLVAGVVGSCVLAIKIQEGSLIIGIGGIVVSFINYIFLNFIAKVGEAIDDIRDKYVYSEDEEIEDDDVD